MNINYIEKKLWCIAKRLYSAGCSINYDANVIFNNDNTYMIHNMPDRLKTKPFLYKNIPHNNYVSVIDMILVDRTAIHFDSMLDFASVLNITVDQARSFHAGMRRDQYFYSGSGKIDVEYFDLGKRIHNGIYNGRFPALVK